MHFVDDLVKRAMYGFHIWSVVIASWDMLCDLRTGMASLPHLGTSTDVTNIDSETIVVALFISTHVETSMANNIVSRVVTSSYLSICSPTTTRCTSRSQHWQFFRVSDRRNSKTGQSACDREM
jgi:hypothetical protein